ncbi:MAG TPA: YsnF/AvaK domain-containing protein [Allosphingosinicella sp.]|nr:YsnF/AvaK domain-containing protein [Allosphingosinicella sp.]
MSRTITAMFDSRAEAETARQRLTQSSIDADNVRIIDQSSAGSSSGSSSGSEGEGFWASIKSAFIPQEDSHAYEEGMRRGGYLVCAQIDEDRADEAIRLLEDSDSVDFDSRQEEWRSDGWAGFGGRTDTGAYSGAGMGGSGLSSEMQGGAFGGSSSSQTDRTVSEERVPVVEEELKVGKREVSRGGARVRSYVRETPVHEQVSLREEHVSVERRPVDQKLGAADLQSGDMFQDRNIEMTETAEEAVVAKEARVREELVVKKTAEERVEQIDDTVRRTEVEVDENMRGSEDRSAFGFKEGSGTSTSTGTGATGYDSRDPQPEGTGYSDRVDKTGL